MYDREQVYLVSGAIATACHFLAGVVPEKYLGVNRLSNHVSRTPKVSVNHMVSIKGFLRHVALLYE